MKCKGPVLQCDLLLCHDPYNITLHFNTMTQHSNVLHNELVSDGQASLPYTLKLACPEIVLSSYLD